MPAALQALSLVGATLIVIAFIGSGSGRIRADGAAYAILNALGSVAIAITVARPLNVGALALQIVWIAWSLVLLRRALRRG